MNTSTQWQLAGEAAQRYQTVLTPTILGPFAQALVDFAQPEPGEKVIDVGCGTGAAARYAAPVVGRAGSVIGVDINAAMIGVARSLPAAAGAAVEWRVASATDLPVADGQVDVALCAQTLQFLPARRQAIAEIHRVLSGRGRAVFSVWCALEDNPYFQALVAQIGRHIGADVAAGLRSAFTLSHTDAILGLLRDAGFRKIEHVRTQLDLPLPDLATFVPRHIGATPMAAGFSRATTRRRRGVVQDIAEQLSEYQDGAGVRVPFRSHMLRGQK